MPYDVFFGPAPYVYDNNEKWTDERVKLMHGAAQPPVRRITDPDLPPMHTLDLHHLSNQTFTKDTPSLKRWFLTAFVAPEDQHLLALPGNVSEVENQILDIHRRLSQKASTGTDEALQTLRKQLLALFKTDLWIGVGLKLVDEGKISIDLLNTLIQWQAGVIQFGEKPFILHNAAVTSFSNNALRDSSEPLLDTLFADLSLDLETIQKSRWGQINAANQLDLREGNWDATLENFSCINVTAYTDIDEGANKLNVHFPSAPLLEHNLQHTKKCLDIPLYSFGFLAYEDFVAAAFFGGRPMQAHLPSATGNLTSAHKTYYGEALITQHDYAHAATYRLDMDGNFNKMTFHQRMHIYAITANALVRNSDNRLVPGSEKFADYATAIIDGASLSAIFFLWDPAWSRLGVKELSAQRVSLLTMFYNEMALAAGMKLDQAFTCSPTASPDRFNLVAQADGKPISLIFEMEDKNFDNEFAQKLYGDFAKLKLLQTQPQAQQHLVRNTSTETETNKQQVDQNQLTSKHRSGSFNNDQK